MISHSSVEIAYYNRAADALAQGQAEAALALYTHILSTKTDCSTALVNRSAALGLLGRHQEAVVDLKQVEPSHPHLNSVFQRSLVSLLIVPESLQALASHSNSVKVLYRLGKALSAAGSLDEAETILSTASQLMPRNARVQEAVSDLKLLKRQKYGPKLPSLASEVNSSVRAFTEHISKAGLMRCSQLCTTELDSIFFPGSENA